MPAVAASRWCNVDATKRHTWMDRDDDPNAQWGRTDRRQRRRRRVAAMVTTVRFDATRRSLAVTAVCQDDDTELVRDALRAFSLRVKETLGRPVSLESTLDAQPHSYSRTVVPRVLLSSTRRRRRSWHPPDVSVACSGQTPVVLQPRRLSRSIHTSAATAATPRRI